MQRHKSWRVMPLYDENKEEHNKVYTGFEYFRKKVLGPLIVIGAFGALIYVALEHDKFEYKRYLERQQKESLEQKVR